MAHRIKFSILMIAVLSLLWNPNQPFAQWLERGDPRTIGNTLLTSDSGQQVRISDFRGKVVFINFWDNWCPPCMEEMNSIRNLQTELKNNMDGIAFVFISAKQNQFQKDGDWLKQHGIVGHDYQWEPRFPEQRYAFFGALPEQTTFAVPTTYILDRNGVVAEFVAAPVDWQTHLGSFRTLLSRRPAEPHFLY